MGTRGSFIKCPGEPFWLDSLLAVEIIMDSRAAGAPARRPGNRGTRGKKRQRPLSTVRPLTDVHCPVLLRRSQEQAHAEEAWTPADAQLAFAARPMHAIGVGAWAQKGLGKPRRYAPAHTRMPSTARVLLGSPASLCAGGILPRGTKKLAMNSALGRTVVTQLTVLVDTNEANKAGRQRGPGVFKSCPRPASRTCVHQQMMAHCPLGRNRATSRVRYVYTVIARHIAHDATVD